MPTQTDPIAELGNKPDIGVLMSEWRRAAWTGPDGVRVNSLDDIRYARWQGQTSDGKKHSDFRSEGNPAWPFEGASDVRCRLADSVCNELSALLLAAFSRADLRGRPTEMSDMTVAAASTTLLKWIKDNKLSNDLMREAELGAQYATQYGWTVFFTGWDQKISKRMQQVKFEEVIQNAPAAAQEMQSDILLQLPEMIADPNAEDQCATIFQGIIPDLTLTDAKRFVKGLRETGVGEIEQEYVSRNLPMVVALKPWDEIAVPPETVDLQSARIIFRRCWMTSVELKGKVISDGWDKDWVESACKTAKGFSGTNMVSFDTASTSLAYRTIDRQNLIEVVYAYLRTMDGDIPAIYYTVFCPSMSSAGVEDVPQVALYELLDYSHGEYPFIEYRLERTRRTVNDSRGVPELVSTDQDEIKAQHDSLRDRTAFETLPPIKVVKRVGQPTRIGPGVPLPVTRPDDYTFMEAPNRAPTTAFSLIQTVEANVANYFGLTHPSVPPVKSQMLQQMRVNAWLTTWTNVFKQVLSLSLQYMAPEEIERIVGLPIPQNLTDVAGGFDLTVKFDVRELDSDYVSEKLAAISKFVIPLDAGGIVDRNRLVKMILDAIAPEVATDLILDQGQASQQMYRQVQSDIGLMMLGSEPLYTENDPAAQAKLNMVQDNVKKNPKAQAALQQDQLFQKLFQNYVQNLQMSITQQKNAQIGRLGVTPLGDQLAQQSAQMQPDSQMSQGLNQEAQQEEMQS